MRPAVRWVVVVVAVLVVLFVVNIAVATWHIWS
jgi:hypothetical protein